MKNADGTLHPATFQPDLCEQLTPATVSVWLKRQGVAAMHRGDQLTAYALADAAEKVERLCDIPASPPADDGGMGGPGTDTYFSFRD